MLTRTDFNVQDFEQLILQKGYRLNWEKAVNCPCLDPVTGHAVEGCPQCDGRGKFYYGAQIIKGIITRQSKELELEAMQGRLEHGSAYVTVPAAYKLSQFDKLTNLDSLGIYNETVIKSANNQDYLRYAPVGPVEIAVTQPTKHSNIVQLEQGIDFTVASDGKIVFTGAHVPAVNTGISFRYNHHPVWLVSNPVNYIRDTFVQLGNTVDTATAMPIRYQIMLEQFGSSRAGD